MDVRHGWYPKDGEQRLFSELLSRGACPGMERIQSLDEAADGCDAVLAITVEGTGYYTTQETVEIVSPPKKILETLSATAGASNFHATLEGLVRSACVQAQRVARLRRKDRTAPAASPVAAAPAVDERKMRELIAQAVREAAPPRSAPKAPETPTESDVDAPKYRREPNPADVAIIVGIEQYQDLPPAALAERDARAVKRHALALGFPERNILLLTGSRATKTSLVKNIETWLARNAGPTSSVLFYYSGHGAPDHKSGRAYLVPWDGDPAFLEETGYPVDRLYAKLGELKARRVVVALDACFSGTGGRSVLAKGTRPLVTRVDMGRVPPRIAALTAARADQVAGTFEEGGHGLFTYFLLQGLNAGKRSTRALHEFLETKVRDEARRQNREQSPTVAGPDSPL